MKCQHHYCRCARARELMQLMDLTGRTHYLREAVEVHEQLVECRLPHGDDPRTAGKVLPALRRRSQP